MVFVAAYCRAPQRVRRAVTPGERVMAPVGQAAIPSANREPGIPELVRRRYLDPACLTFADSLTGSRRAM